MKATVLYEVSRVLVLIVLLCVLQSAAYVSLFIFVSEYLILILSNYLCYRHELAIIRCY